MNIKVRRGGHMPGKQRARIKKWHLLWLPALLLLLAIIGLSANTALAGKLTDWPAKNAAQGQQSLVNQIDAAPLTGSGPSVSASSHGPTQGPVGAASSAPQSPQDDAFMTLEGSLTDFGSLAANPNSGDTVNTGVGSSSTSTCM